MFGLAILLYVQRVSGSFAVAGLVSAGTLVGVSLGSVVQGTADRPDRPHPSAARRRHAVRPRRRLRWSQPSRPAARSRCSWGSRCSPGSSPSLPGASRALWSDLVPPGPRRDAAYSYEAISLEVFFILGPALAAFLVAAPWPGTGAVVAAAAMVLGSAGFALTPPGPRQRARSLTCTRASGCSARSPSPACARSRSRRSASGSSSAAVEVGVPAVTAAAGSPALGGVLLSAWSVSSVVAGVLYSLRPWPRPLHLRMPVLLGGVRGAGGRHGADRAHRLAARARAGDARGGRDDHAAGHRALDGGRRRHARPARRRRPSAGWSRRPRSGWPPGSRWPGWWSRRPARRGVPGRWCGRCAPGAVLWLRRAARVG